MDTVSFGTMSRIGTDWKYVTASPIRARLQSRSFLFLQLVLTLSIAMLLLAFVLSWLASRRIYLPIAQLVSMLDG